MRTIGAFALALVACGSGATAGDAAARFDVAPPTDAALAPADLVVSTDASPPPDLRTSSVDLVTSPSDLSRADLAGYVCYDPGSSFPAFARDCARDGDCYVAIHQVDCCGSHAARGIKLAMSQPFEAAEANFRVVCPALCNCVPRPTVCDDGLTAPENQIAAGCDNGRCGTRCK